MDETGYRTWADPETGECPVAEVLRSLGGKHKTRILHCLVHGDFHFLELTRLLPGISRKVLTEQLRELEASGLVDRTPQEDARRRVLYSLSERGRSLNRILAQIYDWSREGNASPAR